jgi:hypothetical protein
MAEEDPAVRLGDRPAGWGGGELDVNRSGSGLVYQPRWSASHDCRAAAGLEEQFELCPRGPHGESGHGEVVYLGEGRCAEQSLLTWLFESLLGGLHAAALWLGSWRLW